MDKINEIKINYEDYADVYIPNWRKINKNELCNKYLEEDNSNIRGAILSALMSKYWSSVMKYTYKNRGFQSFEDVLDIVYDSIIYALDKHRWTEEDSSIYNDANGPDKSINRRIKSLMSNAYVETTRAKRKLNYNNISLNELTDEYNDYALNLIANDEQEGADDIIRDKEYRDVVRDICSINKDYLSAVLIDLFLHDDCFTSDNMGVISFSTEKAIKLLSRIDDKYVEYFIEQYNIDDLSENDKLMVVFGIRQFMGGKKPYLEYRLDKALDRLKQYFTHQFSIR